MTLRQHPAVAAAPDGACAFVFSMSPPPGMSLVDHLRGDDGADVEAHQKRPPPPKNTILRPYPGLPHYLLWLADHTRGFGCLVVSPIVMACMERVNLIAGTGAKPTWRGYPVYVDTSYPHDGGHLASNRSSPALGHFMLIDERVKPR